MRQSLPSALPAPCTAPRLRPKARARQRLAHGATPASWQALQVGLRLAQAGTVQLSVETNGAAGPTVFFDDVSVAQTGSLIVQEQHQYAFGAPLPGLSYTVGNTRYRHGYQGQFADKDEETGFDSFELRLYNSRIGRWMAPDPAGQFDSPYVGMGNNPVSGTDPDGGFISLFSSAETWGLLHYIGSGLKTSAPQLLRGISTALQIIRTPIITAPTFYSVSRQSQALHDMWSYTITNRQETNGLVTDKGIIVLPTNGFISSTPSPTDDEERYRKYRTNDYSTSRIQPKDVLKIYKDVKGNLYTYHHGEKLKILARIHVHGNQFQLGYAGMREDIYGVNFVKMEIAIDQYGLNFKGMDNGIGVGTSIGHPDVNFSKLMSSNFDLIEYSKNRINKK